MVGCRQMFLDLVHFLREDIRWRIFTTIHHIGLHGLINLRKSHYLRIGAERTHLFVQYFGRLNPQLQTFHVSRHTHRAVRAHHLEAVIPVRQTANTFALQLFQHLLPDRTLRDPVQRLLVVKDERQIKQLEFLDTQRAELGQRGREHLHGAQL